MTICSKCIFTDRTPNIRFNAEGVCHYCRGVNIISPIGIDKLIYKIKSVTTYARSHYDCLIPISGGLDSSYVLYYAVKILRLRCLALHVDMFTSDLAYNNIHNICNGLKVDLETIKVDCDLLSKLIKTSLEFGHLLTPAQCNHWMCQPCGYLIRNGVFNTLKETDIPMYISGKHASEFIPFQPTLRSPISDKIANKHIITYLQKKYYEFLLRCRYNNHCSSYDFSNSIFNLGITNYGYPVIRGTHAFEINLYDYIHYDKDRIIDVLTSELGWKKPDSDYKLVHFDCLIYPLRKFLFESTFGFSLYRVSLSNQIRYGYISRQDAIDACERYNASVCEEDDIGYILNDILRLSEDQINKIKNMRDFYKHNFLRIPDKIGHRGDFVRDF